MRHFDELLEAVKNWPESGLTDSDLIDCSEYGCDKTAPAGFTYYFDTDEFFEAHAVKICDFLHDYAEEMGINYLQMFDADRRAADIGETSHGERCIMIWHVLEILGGELNRRPVIDD